jgi:hypothetical protein
VSPRVAGYPLEPLEPLEPLLTLPFKKIFDLSVSKQLIMKTLYLVLLVGLCNSASSQLSFYGGYAGAVPKGSMNNNINMLHSFNAGGNYVIPGSCGHLQAGIDLGIGTYANESKEQTFNFGNGSSTKTFVIYSSNVLQLNLAAKALLFKNAILNPYASVKAGWASFYSNIFIEDPADPNGCKALDQRNILKDGTITGSFGAGVMLDLSMFCPNLTKGARSIDFSINHIRGGNISYINTKKLIDAANPPMNSEGKAVNVKFVNATTQQIHEHQVAEVYTTPLKFMEFKVTAVFNLRCD